MKISYTLDYIKYAPLSIIILLSRFMPFGFMMGMAKGIGWLGYYLMPKRRNIAYLNLKAAFAGRYTSFERKAIVKKLFVNLGMNFMELLLLPRYDNAWYEKNVIWKNFDLIAEVLKRGKGLIFLTAHFGNWEISSVSACRAGYPMFVIGRIQKPKFLFELIVKHRESAGCRHLTKGMALREMIRGLEANEILGVLGDQGGRKGIKRKFFGRNVFIAEGSFRMSQTTGAVIIPAFIRRENGKHILVIEKPILGDKVPVTDEMRLKAIDDYVRILESYITKYPDQWMWVNRRWKHTRDWRIMILDDGKLGHLRQMQAAAQIIRRNSEAAETKTVKVEFRGRTRRFLINLMTLLFRGRFFSPLALLRFALTEQSYKELDSTYADIIICAGAASRAAALLAGRENQARTISMMDPVPFGTGAFDLCLVPEHDRPAEGENVFLTRGALNLISPEYLKEQADALRKDTVLPKGLKIGLLFGGDSKTHIFSESQARSVVRAIKDFAQAEKAGVCFTTSRRTPPKIDELMHAEFDSFKNACFKVFARENNPAYAVGGILGVCDVLIVSGESISMVSEAAASGKYTIVFRPEKRDPGRRLKHELFLENLAAGRHIRLTTADDIAGELSAFRQKKYSLKALDQSKEIAKIIKERILG